MSSYDFLGHGIYHLDAHYIQPGVASLYCMVEKDEVVIIETGTSHSLPHVQQFLADRSLTADQVKYVMPTHVHLDHAGGAGVMMRAFPHAQLIIHPRGARHMIDPQKLIQATIDVYGEEKYHRLYGEIPPIDESRVIRAEHEDRFEAGGRELLILDTPGHAYHHYCVYDEVSSGIFSGDTFGVSYPNMLIGGKRVVLPTTTPIHFNPDALHRSVEMLMSFDPQQVFLTHYNVLKQPAGVVDQYRQWIDRLVELTEQVAPSENSRITLLIDEIGNAVTNELGLSAVMVQTQLDNDITLDAQGLAFWYQHREQ